jgi:hypothetical protein
MQPDGKECDYYVMKLIHDIITVHHESNVLPEVLKMIIRIFIFFLYVKIINDFCTHLNSGWSQVQHHIDKILLMRLKKMIVEFIKKTYDLLYLL